MEEVLKKQNCYFYLVGCRLQRWALEVTACMHESVDGTILCVAPSCFKSTKLWFMTMRIWMFEKINVGCTTLSTSGCHLIALFERQHLGWAWWLMPVVPALWEAKMGESRCHEFKTILVKMVKPCLTENTKKISQTWWQEPVIPAIWEAEAENCLNPGGGGCSELRLHHCTPAWATERDCI